MELNLKGKKAIVTGGTRGIGRAIADRFAAAGADVAICARNTAQVRGAVGALRAMGIQAFGTAVDVADSAALKTWVDRAAHDLGGIDIVVANPSAFGIGNSEADWQSSFSVDLMAAVRTIGAATPALIQAAAKNGDAAIVVVASVLAAETDGESAYGAMKAALTHFTKGVARRLASQGVRANVISPGTIYVADGFWGNAQQRMPELYEAYLKRNPLGRMGSPHEIAAVAAFLASPLASFTTGANIVVDGAFTNRVQF